MYGRLNQRKLKEQDYILSCEKARQQLDEYIDIESKRVNIDSAKKRAVLQHMDYEGFRQMVLGANIFATKSNELYSFSKGEHPETITNRLFKDDQEEDGSNSGDYGATHKKDAKNMAVGADDIFRKAEGKSELECTSFREFKKKFYQYWSKNKEQQSATTTTREQNTEYLYSALLKNQRESNLKKIFNMECEANILLEIISLFDQVLKHLKNDPSSANVMKEMAFMIKFLQIVLTLKNMKDFNLSILTKKEKLKIIGFLQESKEYLLFKNAVNNEKPSEKSQNSTSNIESTVEASVEKESQQSHRKEQKSSQSNIEEDSEVIESLIKILRK